MRIPIDRECKEEAAPRNSKMVHSKDLALRRPHLFEPAVHHRRGSEGFAEYREAIWIRARLGNAGALEPGLVDGSEPHDVRRRESSLLLLPSQTSDHSPAFRYI